MPDAHVRTGVLLVQKQQRQERKNAHSPLVVDLHRLELDRVL
jgi:hypothetical protein